MVEDFSLSWRFWADGMSDGIRHSVLKWRWGIVRGQVAGRSGMDPASNVAGGDHKPCLEFRGEPGLLVDCRGTPAVLFRFGELGRRRVRR